MILEGGSQSQATEDGFQRMRDVTGITDVMAIVEKFLNRDLEHQELNKEVETAEKKLSTMQSELKELEVCIGRHRSTTSPYLMFHHRSDCRTFQKLETHH